MKNKQKFFILIGFYFRSCRNTSSNNYNCKHYKFYYLFKKKSSINF